MLLQLKDQAEIVIVISAADIEKNKIRGDLGITYDEDVLRLIDEFRAKGLYVGSVVHHPVCRTAFRRRASASRLTLPGYPGVHATTRSPVIRPTFR